MRDLAHHADQAASLDRFADLDPEGDGVGGALAVALGDRPDLDVEDLRLEEPRWNAASRSWARELGIPVRVGGRDPVRIAIAVPWLVGDDARSAAPPDIRLGSHTGTYVGRPGIPGAALVRSPGVRTVVRPMPGGTQVTVDVVPRFGTTWVVRAAPGRAGVVEVRGSGVTLAPGAGRGTVDDAGRFHALLALHPFRIDPSILDHGLEALNGRPRPSRATSVLTEEDLALVVEHVIDAQAVADTWPEGVPPEGLPAAWVTALDPAARHLAWYGDLLTDAAYRGARAAVRRIAEARERRAAKRPEAEYGVLARRLRLAFEAVGRGAGAYADAVVAERPRNTLALLEAQRRVTFLGPGGLPRLRGRMDLRTLPPGWRGVLCPVQTPESEKVGLHRHLALGTVQRQGPDDVVERYADLSPAAALVPFVGHDDPTRTALAAKMLSQALVVTGAEAPVVRTGVERLIAEEAGVLRAPAAGLTSLAGSGLAQVGTRRLAFGPPAANGSGQDLRWLTTPAAEGDYVARGDVLAHAPDVAIEGDGAACLRLGLNALVALVPWFGWNYEDGIVVSEAFAARATSEHLVQVATACDPGDVSRDGDFVVETVRLEDLADPVPAGTTVVALVDSAGKARKVLSFPEDATLVPNGHALPFRYVRLDADVLSVRFRVRRPLMVGDKLTTRHGGKGVVTRILPVQEMPRLPDGTPVEVILNPLGLLRRLNVGTVLEANVALARRLRGDEEPVVAPRRLGREGRLALAEELARLGAPGGRLSLTLADGGRVGPVEGVVVGDIYLLKLDHLAVAKAGGRADAGRSPVTLQPSRTSGWGSSRKLGSPQRLGEMEVWALQAIGADATLRDLLRNRGVGTPELRDALVLPAGLRAALAHLAVAGLHVEAETDDGARVDLTTVPGTDPARVRALVTRWRGSGDRGLTDVETLRPRAVEEIQALGGHGRTAAKAEPGVAPGRLARRLLDLALAAAHDPDRSPPAEVTEGGDPRRPPAGPFEWPAALADETVTHGIRLVRPVPHPWMLRVGRAEVRLPELEHLAILPPACFLTRTGPSDDDPLRQHFEDVIAANLRLEAALASGAASEVEAQHRILADKVVAVLGTLEHTPASGTVAGRLSGKFGILRRCLLGSSATHSCRAVLTGDPTQPVESVGLPRGLLDDLGVPAEPTGCEDVVLVNRQPTLHPYGLVALRAAESPDQTVRLHPYLLRALAGDFDGDTAAVHRPVSEAARAELWERCRPAATPRSAASGALLGKLDLDVAVGLRLRTLTADGRADLAAELGLHDGVGDVAGVGLDHEPLTPRAIEALAEVLLDGAADPGEGVERMATLMQAGWAGATGWGLSVIDVPDLVTRDQFDTVSLGEGTGPLGRIGQAVAAGAAGKPVDLLHLLVDRGEAAPSNTLLPAVPVDGTYLDGLADADYYAAAQPAVAGLAAKKLVTPFAGALTKRLVEIGYEVTIAGEDCGLKPAGGGGARDGGGAVVRSPLTCRGPNPCRACYGPDPATGAPPPVGRRVGVFAGMLVGEQSTQLALKSIHRRDGAGSLAAGIAELEGIFGRGRFTCPLPADSDADPDAPTLRRLLRRVAGLDPEEMATDDAERLVAVDLAGLLRAADARGFDARIALEPALRRFEDLLSGVERVHAAVLLRQFVEAFRQIAADVDAKGRPRAVTARALAHAARTAGRGVLALAATQGDLGPLVRDAARDAATVAVTPRESAPGVGGLRGDHLRRLILGDVG